MPSASSPAATRKTTTRIMRAVRSWRCFAEYADCVLGERACRRECRDLRFGSSDPGLRRGACRIRQMRKLGHGAGNIALRRPRFGARDDIGGIVAPRLVDRSDAHQPLGIL